ncbi:MAG: ABC-2 family transporter protein [Chloroflexi bacterium]|nr:ABC-2 family transporter protein [Chloroflexota bacterium]
MKAYLAIVSARFRMLLQYRAAAAAGFATRLFWGLIRMMIFEAFYRSSTAAQPMTYPQVVTYVWLGQAMLAMTLWSVDSDLQAMIRSGTVAYELVRPLDLYWLWFCRSVASRSAPTLLQAIPVFIVAGLFFGLKPPPSWASAGAWILSLAASLLLASALAVLVTITLLWTVAGDGIARMAPVLVYTLSGMLIPLPLFPRWLQPVLNFLPFRGLVDIPFRVYMGSIAPEHAVILLLHQLGWTAAIIGLGRLLVTRGLGRLVVQGG